MKSGTGLLLPTNILPKEYFVKQNVCCGCNWF